MYICAVYLQLYAALSVFYTFSPKTHKHTHNQLCLSLVAICENFPDIRYVVLSWYKEFVLGCDFVLQMFSLIGEHCNLLLMDDILLCSPSPDVHRRSSRRSRSPPTRRRSSYSRSPVLSRRSRSRSLSRHQDKMSSRHRKR